MSDGLVLSPPGPNAVHLCVDMQNLFAPGGPWPTPWMEKALPSVAQLAAHSPERTVFTRFIPPASASEAGGMWHEYYKSGRMSRETGSARIFWSFFRSFENLCRLPAVSYTHLTLPTILRV